MTIAGIKKIFVPICLAILFVAFRTEGSLDSFNDDNKICFTDTSIPCVTDSELAANIDNFARQVFDCHETTTAMTLAVVKDGRIVLTKGYGQTRVKQGQPVTSRTRLAIGSVTKAFTATIINEWLHKNNKTVDTPIQSFYPEFRSIDDMRSNMATFRDLLAHRMGLSTFVRPLVAGFSDISRDEFVRSMTYMPTWLTFREKFEYNNYMYTAAANVIEKLSQDKTWEDMVMEQLLIPLNMTNTGFFRKEDFINYNNKNNNAQDTEKNTSGGQTLVDDVPIPDFATGCAEFNGTLEDIPPSLWVSVDPCGPAGSIYSNAEDMAKWVIFQLSKGQGPSGNTVIDPNILTETWKSTVLMGSPDAKSLQLPASPFSHVSYGYGLGWMSSNYRGYRHVHHSGGYLTHTTQLWLFPDVDAGLYITVNGPQTRKRKRNLLKSLTYYISDALLGETHWFNASVACKGLPDFSKNSTDSCPDETLDESGTATDFECTECPDLNLFLGTYTHKAFGNMSIFIAPDGSEEKRLANRFGRFGEVTFVRVSEYRFEGNYTGQMKIFNVQGKTSETLLFNVNKMGHVDGLQYLLLGNNKWTTFKRVTEKPESKENTRDIGSNMQSNVMVTVLAIYSAILIFM